VIDFRYHIVSIVAVFLALAIGIVFGSTALRGPLYNTLNNTSASWKSDYENANSQLGTANALAAADDSFIQSIEGSYLNGKLTGQRIVIFAEPGESSAVVSGVTKAAQDAGATVVAQVNLTDKFFDSSQSTQAALSTLNASVAGTSGIQLDSGVADEQQATAQVLASQLLVKATSDPSATGTASWTASQAQTALADYQQDGYLTVSGGQMTEPGTLAVVVTTNNTLSDGTADPLAQALAPFVSGLDNTTSTVVAGAAATSGSGTPMALLRQSGSSVTSKVSTVDDADTARGQIAVVEALYGEINGGSAGSWGIDSGDNYPVITATSPASPAASATPTTKKKSGK
jgi:hypothetical protein